VDQRTRRELTRFAAPAAFLAAATIAVLLIKAGLSGGSGETTTASVSTAATTSTVTQTRHTTTTSTTTAARYYTIESGDTLGSVAIKEHTTVEDLLRLNPGIDPQALHVGQRIRVG
jgi:peptidoglycan endopeptidase LytE